MAEQQGAVKFKGNPMTLVGSPVKVGDAAPDVAGVGQDLKDVKISDLAGKTVVLVTVPSLDTPVCDTEARRFNTEAGKLGDGVQVVVVSMDLPFAQKRWCGAAGVQNVTTLSDWRGAKVGQAFGVLIKELYLLARAVFVIGPDGKVTYKQLVSEVTQEPDYDAVLAAVK